MDSVGAIEHSWNKEQNRLLLLSFAGSFVLVLVAYIIAGIAPFGNNTLMAGDSSNQLVYFLGYFRDLLLGKQDAFYALEKTIGGNVIGLLGYYTLSPLNVLFLLFPIEEMPLAIHSVVLLKLSICGLTMALFFKHTGGLKKSSLLFCVSYSLCAYNVSFSWALMWLDGVVLLPLVALGLFRISHGKSPWLYIISLSTTIVTCYYIGYMMCAFSVLYFIYLLYTENETKIKLKKRISIFSLSSIGAGGLSAAVFLPVILSQTDSKRVSFFEYVKYYTYTRSLMVLEFICPEKAAEHDSMVKYVLLAALFLVSLLCIFFGWLFISKRVAKKWKVVGLFSISALLAVYALLFESQDPFIHKLIVGFVNHAEMSGGRPGIYSSLLCLVLAVSYFVKGAITKKKKIGAAAFLAMLLISMRFYIPNLMWHGFTENSGFEYRYSFIFSFFLISIARNAYDAGNYKPKDALVAIGFTAVLLVAAHFSKIKLADPLQYALITICITLMAILLVFNERPKHKKFALTAITILHLASVLAVPCISWPQLAKDREVLYSDIQFEINRVAKISDEVKKLDDGLYRANIGTTNSPMLHNYNGTSHFSSNEEGYVVSFLEKLGVARLKKVWADGNLGSTNAFLSLFGVKYYFNDEELICNENALPLAFVSSPKVIGADITSRNVFLNLNSIFKSIYPEIEDDVFTELTTDKEYINLVPCSEHQYAVKDLSDEGELRYSFVVKTSDPLVFYCDHAYGNYGEIYLNGEHISSFSDWYEWRVINLGSFEPGEKLTLSIILDNIEGITLTDSGRICHESIDTIARYYDGIMSQKCLIESDTDSSFLSQINSNHDGQYLLYTIPYDASWRVTVDGKRVSAEKAFDFFMAVPIDEGVHSVELKYHPRGLNAGVVISGISILVMLFIHMSLKRIKNKL